MFKTSDDVNQLLSHLQVILSVPAQLFFCINHSSHAVNAEQALDTTFTSVIATDNAIFNVGIWTNVAIICHHAIHSEMEVRCREARDTHSILKIKKARSFIILIGYGDNDSCCR